MKRTANVRSWPGASVSPAGTSSRTANRGSAGGAEASTFSGSLPALRSVSPRVADAPSVTAAKSTGVACRTPAVATSAPSVTVLSPALVRRVSAPAAGPGASEESATWTVSDPPAAIVVPGAGASPTENGAAGWSKPVTVSGSSPSLPNVTVVAPSEPSTTSPTDAEDGPVRCAGAIPRPLSATVRTPLPSPALIVHASVTVPGAVGVNFTCSVLLCPAVSWLASSSASRTWNAALPGGLDFVMVIVLSPVFLTTTDAVALCPTTTAPNCQPSLGDTDSLGPMPALPLSPTVLAPAVVVTTRSSLKSPTAVGR